MTATRTAERIAWLRPYKPARWKESYWSRIGRGWVAERKEDGWRVEIVHQFYGMIEVFSSSGRRLQTLEAQFAHLPLPVGTMLDAEAVVADPLLCDCEREGREIGFDATAHFLSAHPGGIELHVFDLLVDRGLYLTGAQLRERRHLGRQLVRQIGDPRLCWVESRPGWSENLQVWIEGLREQGAEGVVFKRLDSPYKAGSRTVDWLKMKWGRLAEADVVVKDVLGPTEKMAPYLRRLGYGYADTGVVGVLPIGGVTEARAKQMLGQVVELRGHEIMPSGALLYPKWSRLRPDKRAEDCVLNAEVD